MVSPFNPQCCHKPELFFQNTVSNSSPSAHSLPHLNPLPCTGRLQPPKYSPPGPHLNLIQGTPTYNLLFISCSGAYHFSLLFNFSPAFPLLLLPWSIPYLLQPIVILLSLYGPHCSFVRTLNACGQIPPLHILQGCLFLHAWLTLPTGCSLKAVMMYLISVVPNSAFHMTCAWE